VSGRPRVALLSAYPPAHYGTVSRFTRWVPYIERAAWHADLLTPAGDSEWADFETGAPGAVGRYYRACLQAAWHNVRRARSADAVVLHRGLVPFSPWQRPSFERELARLNPRLVYDFYDAIWLQRQDASEGAGSALARWLHPADKVEEIIRMARVVTVSNEPLADFARGFHGDVRIIPMLLEASAYEPRVHAQRSPVVIGWMGNRHQIPRLLSLTRALQRLAASRDVLVRVVSPVTVEIPGVPVESLTHPWSEQSEIDDLSALDIGLLPLEDNEHDRGKSPLKLLQYSAAGLPLVATPVGMDVEHFRPGETFLAARTEDDWVEALTRLVDDHALRARLGTAARRVVVDRYSFESWSDPFMDALRSAAE
jgi:glycosyltransferase involved in cell wall biosynthesis